MDYIWHLLTKADQLIETDVYARSKALAYMVVVLATIGAFLMTNWYESSHFLKNPRNVLIVLAIVIFAIAFNVYGLMLWFS